MAVIELVDNYESGRGTLRGRQETVKRVLLTDTYDGWRDEVGVPQYGDAHPDDSALRVVEVAFEGYGNMDPEATTVCKYRQAKLTVTYSTNTGQDVAISRFEVTEELLAIGGGGYYQSSGNSIDHPRLIPITVGTLWLPRQYAYPDYSAVDAKIGYINDATWTPEGRAFAAGVARCCGYNQRKVWSPSDNALVEELECVFRIRFIGWNTGWDGVAGGWDTVMPLAFPSTSFNSFPP